jgi:hypothetical protein
MPGPPQSGASGASGQSGQPVDQKKKPADQKAGAKQPGASDRNARRAESAAGKKKGATGATGADGDSTASGWGGDAGAMTKKAMPMLVTDKYATTTIPELTMWEPGEMKLDGTVVAIGKRRTGKSFAFRHILHSLKKEFCAGICISQTDELNKYWRQYMPAKYIFNRFNPQILLAVFERQKAILNDKRYTEEEREKRARFFIILDNVISDPKIRYDPSIAELFVAGRHYKLFVMITTQYAKAITPTLRSNADYVLILNDKQEAQR